MNRRKTKLIHHRDNIIAELREKIWEGGSKKNAINRLSRGEMLFGDGHLIKILATLVAAELAIADENMMELGFADDTNRY